MREIVFDTETTGLYATGGDRIVEIGAVELDNHLPTGRTFHQYINPERDMPAEAFRIHGLSEDFLSDFPVFAEIAPDFVDFIADSSLVAHNARFDIQFINAELDRLGISKISNDRVIDTLLLAQQRFPGAPVSLDALCRRFGVDLSVRSLHGALLDSELLAECYLELIGGRQTNFALEVRQTAQHEVKHLTRTFRQPREFVIPRHEIDRHAEFIARIDDAIWTR